MPEFVQQKAFTSNDLKALLLNKQDLMYQITNPSGNIDPFFTTTIPSLIVYSE
jgi:hypothetical protein